MTVKPAGLCPGKANVGSTDGLLHEKLTMPEQLRAQLSTQAKAALT